MPKQRQIPNLFPRQLADGTIVYHWKPSAKLRRAGFVNQRLGTDQSEAVRLALDLNAQVAGCAPVDRPDAGKAGPRRIWRFRDLVAHFRAHSDFQLLRASTRREYDVRLRQLDHWAMDGTLLVRDLDAAMVRELREGLLQGSTHKAAAILRVLRLLLAFAEREGIVTKGANPASQIRIPDPTPRRVRMDRPVREAIAAAADALGLVDVPLMIDLGLWLIQREADLLELNRLAWREIGDPEVDPRHLAALVDPRGRVMGFRLQQNKTGAWVDAPVPPFLHDAIRLRLDRKGAGWLFPHPSVEGARMPGHLFQRRFDQARDAASAVAIMDGNMALAEAIDTVQFRDLRRTGMIAYRDAGAKEAQITALSGHFVLGRKTILDTYMPGDTAGAIACVAAGVRQDRARLERQAV